MKLGFRLIIPIVETKDWGIDIIDAKIKDIQLPENMKRMMASQAEAEEQAAGKLLEAGLQIDKSPSAIILRLYQTLSNIALEKKLNYFIPIPRRSIT